MGEYFCQPPPPILGNSPPADKEDVWQCQTIGNLYHATNSSRTVHRSIRALLELPALDLRGATILLDRTLKLDPYLTG